MRLWIDDERPMPWEDQIWHVHAKTSDEAIKWLDTWRRNNAERGKPLGHLIKEVSFDHDLGGEDTTRRVMLWMIENDVWPEEITIHTMNKVGREWLLGMANRYAPPEVVISQLFL